METFRLSLQELLRRTFVRWRLLQVDGTFSATFTTDLRSARLLDQCMTMGTGTVDDSRWQPLLDEIRDAVLEPIVSRVLSISPTWHVRVQITSNPSPLLRIPWPHAARNANLAPGSFSLSVAPQGPGRPLAHPPVIDAALGVYASPSAMPVLDIDQETRLHEGIFGEAHVKFTSIHPASETEMLQALEEYPASLLHLSGHGTPDRLLVVERGGGSHRVDVSSIIGRIPSAAFVVLSICSGFASTSDSQNAERTATTIAERWQVDRLYKHEAQLPALSIALKHGITVIGFDTSVPDEYAIEFSRFLYSALLVDQMPLSKAVHLATDSAESATGFLQIRPIAVIPQHVDPTRPVAVQRSDWQGPISAHAYIPDSGTLAAVREAVKAGVPRIALLGPPHIGKASLLQALTTQLQTEAWSCRMTTEGAVFRSPRNGHFGHITATAVTIAEHLTEITEQAPLLVIWHYGYPDALAEIHGARLPIPPAISENPATWAAFYDFCPPIPSAVYALCKSPSALACLRNGTLRSSWLWEPGVRHKQLTRCVRGLADAAELYLLLTDISTWVADQLRGLSTAERTLLSFYAASQNPHLLSRFTFDEMLASDTTGGSPPATPLAENLRRRGLLEQADGIYRVPPSLHDAIAAELRPREMRLAHSMNMKISYALAVEFAAQGDQRFAGANLIAAFHSGLLAQDWVALSEMLPYVASIPRARVAISHKVPLLLERGAPPDLLERVRATLSDEEKADRTYEATSWQDESPADVFRLLQLGEDGFASDEECAPLLRELLAAITSYHTRDRQLAGRLLNRLVALFAGKLPATAEILSIGLGGSLYLVSYLGARDSFNYLKRLQQMEQSLPVDEEFSLTVTLIEARLRLFYHADVDGADERMMRVAAFLFSSEPVRPLLLNHLSIAWGFYLMSVELSLERIFVMIGLLGLLPPDERESPAMLTIQRGIDPAFLEGVDAPKVIAMIEAYLHVDALSVVSRRTLLEVLPAVISAISCLPPEEDSGVLRDSEEILIRRAATGDLNAEFVLQSAVLYLQRHPRRIGRRLHAWIENAHDGAPDDRSDSDEDVLPDTTASVFELVEPLIPEDGHQAARLLAVALSGDPLAVVVVGLAVLTRFLMDGTRALYGETADLLNLGQPPDPKALEWEEALLVVAALDRSHHAKLDPPEPEWALTALSVAKEEFDEFIVGAGAGLEGCAALIAALWPAILRLPIEPQGLPFWLPNTGTALSDFRRLSEVAQRARTDAAVVVNVAEQMTRRASTTAQRRGLELICASAELESMAGDNLLRAANIILHVGAFALLEWFVGEAVPVRKWGSGWIRGVLGYYVGFARMVRHDLSGAREAWDTALELTDASSVHMVLDSIISSAAGITDDRDLLISYVRRYLMPSADVDGQTAAARLAELEESLIEDHAEAASLLRDIRAALSRELGVGHSPT